MRRAEILNLSLGSMVPCETLLSIESENLAGWERWNE